MGSKRFRINKTDVINILKVLGWTIVTSLVIALIDLNATLEYPETLLILQPVINTVLVGIKKFVEDNS